MFRNTTIMGTLPGLILALAALASSAVPPLISYQGSLRDSNGDPVNGSIDVDLAIYDAATGGAVIWSESQTDIEVVDGSFLVLLGAANPIGDSAFSDPDRWLGVSVNGGAELQPRIRLTSSPYTHRVSTIDGASGGNISGDLDVTGNIHSSGNLSSGNSITIDGVNDKITASSGTIDFDNEDLVTTGDVGIGTTSPTSPLHVDGTGRQIRIVDSNVNSSGWGFGHLSGNQFVITDQQAATDRLVIDGAGNVGIGTTTPTQLLHLGGGSLRLDNGRAHDVTLYIEKDNGYIFIAKPFYPAGLFRAPSGGIFAR